MTLLSCQRRSSPKLERRQFDRINSMPLSCYYKVIVASLCLLNVNLITAFSGTPRAIFGGCATICFSTQSPSSSSSSYLTESEQETLLNLRRVEKQQHQQQQTRSGRSKDEKQREISEGRILSSSAAVQVLDFASVKDHTSKAEQALIQARQTYMNKLPHAKPYFLSSIAPSSRDKQHSVETGAATTQRIIDQQREQQQSKTSTLMGINEAVIREVGHPIGEFLQRHEDIQDVAAWLRSQAPPSLFQQQTREETKSSYSPHQEQTFRNIVSQAYQESGEVTEAFAKTFYLGTQLMKEDAKKAIWAIYVWCRRTDEIVDAPRESDEEMLRDLSAWEIRLERLWEYGEVVDVLDLPLLHVRIQYPNLSIQPFSDMIRGMLMDIPELGQDRYESFEELHLYCYRVAGTVGLMSMPIFGCASGFTDDDAKEPALSLGVAFQLTNILRDVGEDASRGRIYLPQEDMARFNVTEDQIFEKRMDDNYKRLMEYEIARARRYYERAKRGVRMLSPDSRWPVQSSLDCYAQILDRIEGNGYNSLQYRAYVGKFEKLCTLPLSWYRTLEISDIFPIPGDVVGAN